MIKRRRYTVLFSLIVFFSCQKEKYFDGPEFWEDDFETYTSFEELIIEDNRRWSLTQITQTENNIFLDTTFAHLNGKSLRFEAGPTRGDMISKASLKKQKMAFWDGETVEMNAWYFIESSPNTDWLFLIDIEEQSAIGAGPGMRLALVEQQLRIEYKFNEKDILQKAGEEIDFPFDQWVHLKWEIKLSKKNKGRVRLWQNSQLIIQKENVKTLPTDLLYFQQGTKGMYSSFEIGITANTRSSAVKLWVDDVSIRRIP